MENELSVPVQEVMFTPAPDLAKPVVIVSAIEVEYVNRCMAAVATMEITDADSNRRAAELLNEMGRAATRCKNKALDLGRPFHDESNRIGAEVNVQFLDPIGQVQKALNSKMLAFKKIQDDEFMRQKAEAERLAAEARQRKIEAEKKLAKAKTEKGFEAAAMEHDKALEVASLAVAMPAPLPPEKPKGVKITKTPFIDDYDLALLPLTYHTINETKVKAHIKDGTITPATPGLNFHIEESFGGTGR